MAIRQVTYIGRGGGAWRWAWYRGRLLGALMMVVLVVAVCFSAARRGIHTAGRCVGRHVLRRGQERRLLQRLVGNLQYCGKKREGQGTERSGSWYEGDQTRGRISIPFPLPHYDQAIPTP